MGKWFVVWVISLAIVITLMYAPFIAVVMRITAELSKIF